MTTFTNCVPSPECASWFRTALTSSINDLTSHQRRQSAALNKRKSELASMQDRLLNAYLAGTVEEVIYKAKSNELKSEAARTDEALAKLGNVAPAHRDLAVAVFDWSQRAPDAWQGSNTYVRRQILDVVYLNRTLTDVTLVTTKRKPFDALAERPKIEKSRGDRTAIELFAACIRAWDSNTFRLVSAHCQSIGSTCSAATGSFHT